MPLPLSQFAISVALGCLNLGGVLFYPRKLEQIHIPIACGLLSPLAYCRVQTGHKLLQLIPLEASIPLIGTLVYYEYKAAGSG